MKTHPLNKLVLAVMLCAVSAIPGCLWQKDKPSAKQSAFESSVVQEKKVKLDVADASDRIKDQAKGSSYGTGVALNQALQDTNSPIAWKAVGLGNIFNEETKLLLGPPSIEDAEKYRQMVMDYTSGSIDQQKRFDASYDDLTKRFTSLQDDKSLLEQQLKTETEKREMAQVAFEKQAALDAGDAQEWRNLQRKNIFMKIMSFIGPIGLAAACFFFPALMPFAGRIMGWMSSAFTPKASGLFGVVPTSTLTAAVTRSATFSQSIAALVEHNKTVPPDQQVKIDPQHLLVMYHDIGTQATDTNDQNIINHIQENVAPISTAAVNVANVIAKVGA